MLGQSMLASSPPFFRVFVLPCRVLITSARFKTKAFLSVHRISLGLPSHRIKIVRVVLRLQSSCDSRKVCFFMLGCRRQEGLDFLPIRTELFQGKFHSDACNRRQVDLSVSESRLWEARRAVLAPFMKDDAPTYPTTLRCILRRRR